MLTISIATFTISLTNHISNTQRELIIRAGLLSVWCGKFRFTGAEAVAPAQCF